MNGVDVEDLCGTDNGGNVEIALRGWRWSNTGSLVGEAHVQRIAIDVAVNSNRLDAHLFAGPDNATGNLAAIGDQDLLELARIKRHKIHATKKHKMHKIRLVRFVLLWLTLNTEKRLPVLYRLAVLNVNLDYFSTRLGLNLVHELHGFDNTNNCVVLDVAADLHKCIRTG